MLAGPRDVRPDNRQALNRRRRLLQLQLRRSDTGRIDASYCPPPPPLTSL